jgi:hypothetical protein
VGNNITVTEGSINGMTCTDGDGTAANYGIRDVKTDAQSRVYFYPPVSAGNETVELKANNACYNKSYTRNSNHNNAAILTIPAYGISLSPKGMHTFDPATYDYGDQSGQALTVTVTNKGTQATGTLTIAGSNDFTLSPSTLSI